MRMLAMAGGMIAAWGVAWKFIAPFIGVQPLNPGEAVQSLTIIAGALTTGGEAGVTLIGTSFGLMLWMLPVFVALYAMAAIVSGIGCVVSRFTGTSASEQ